MINKVTLIGHVGQDPTIKTIGENNTKVASFSLATTEKRTNKVTGERTDHTDWHSIVVWNKLADIVENYVKQGSQLYVSGKIRYERYEKEGVTHYSTKIIANEIKLLGRKPEGVQQPQQPQTTDYNVNVIPNIVIPQEEEDLPF